MSSPKSNNCETLRNRQVRAPEQPAPTEATPLYQSIGSSSSSKNEPPSSKLDEGNDYGSPNTGLGLNGDNSSHRGLDEPAIGSLHSDIVHDSSEDHLPDSRVAPEVDLDNDPDLGHVRGQNAVNFEHEGRGDIREVLSDHGYAESLSTSYCSTLRSEAEDYYWENGRRYHNWGGGRYLLPNDDQELNREDMKHHMWRLVLEGGLHLSPIGPHPQRILDIGTGSGIWAMQMADTYPSAEVIGFDISPVQPSWVPPNLQFEVDDLEQQWLWKHDSFDLVHCRFMFISVRDWPAMLAQAYQTLKPGGFIELSELGLHPEPAYPGMPTPPAVGEWLTLQGESLKKKGLDMGIASKYKQLLVDAGFEAVIEDVRDLPWGQWPEDKRMKMIGYWHVEQLQKGLHGILAASFSRAGWKPVELEVFIAKLKREMNDSRLMLRDRAYIVYGRKPQQS